MRKFQLVLLVGMFLICVDALLYAQEKYTARQLTSDPAQDGFPSWYPDGNALVYSRFSWKDSLGRNGIWRINVDNSESEQIFSGIAEHPKLSPDGRRIVFDADTGSSMRMIDADGSNPRKFIPDSILIRNGGLPCWSPSGSHIAFVERTGPSLCVLDVATGEVATIFSQEGQLPLPGCWSPDGESILVALRENQTRKSTMWRVSRDGKTRQQIAGHHDAFYRYIALSPDGSLLLYGAMEGKDVGLWVMFSEGGKSLPLVVTHPGHNDGPAWSPDGKRLAFASTRSGNHEIWMMELDIERIKNELKPLDQ